MEETHKKSKKSVPKIVIYVLIFVFGFFSMIAFRYVNIQDTSVHYHANFALYINGQRDAFDSFTFYEEVQSCGSDDANNVKARVHMHDKNSSLVHVHDNAVTWGMFFANLGYGLSKDSVSTDDGVFVDGANDNELTFILNGKQVASVANELIRSEDVLLINYGIDDDETLKSRINSINTDAHDANSKHDPASCSGGHELTVFQKLKLSVGLN